MSLDMVNMFWIVYIKILIIDCETHTEHELSWNVDAKVWSEQNTAEEIWLFQTNVLFQLNYFELI